MVERYGLITEDNYLDLWDIFANELVGDPMLFLIVSLVILWFLSAKMKMPIQLSILFGLLLIAVFFAANTSMIILWVFVVLIVGLLFYYAVNKILR